MHVLPATGEQSCMHVVGSARHTSEIFPWTALNAFCHESGRSVKSVSWVMGRPFLAISTPVCCCAAPKRLGEDCAPSSETAEEGDKKLALDAAPNKPPD